MYGAEPGPCAWQKANTPLVRPHCCGVYSAVGVVGGALCAYVVRWHDGLGRLLHSACHRDGSLRLALVHESRVQFLIGIAGTNGTRNDEDDRDEANDGGQHYSVASGGVEGALCWCGSSIHAQRAERVKECECVWGGDMAARHTRTSKSGEGRTFVSNARKGACEQ